VQKQVVKAFQLCLVLKCHYFLIELVEKKATVLDDGPIVSGLERQKRIELLDQDRDENIPDICIV
jgi:hypothetical protein